MYDTRRIYTFEMHYAYNIEFQLHIFRRSVASELAFDSTLLIASYQNGIGWHFHVFQSL